jgi:S-adenosylmethionine hydrolase
MLYNNELMRIAVAVNQGSFAETYGLKHGPEWQIEIRKY